MKRGLLVLGALAVMTSACGERGTAADAGAATATATAEKDSLLSEVLETTKLVNDLNAELAKARGVGVSPVLEGEQAATGKAAERQIVLGKVREVVARLTEAEAQLEKTRARLATVTAQDKKLLAQIDQYKKTLTELRTTTEAQMTELNGIIASQREEIGALRQDRDTLLGETYQLTADKQAYQDSVRQMTVEKNRVYVLAGTKAELEKKGIVVSEGSKFLVFGGKQTVPARTLDPEQFIMLDKTEDKVIPLPNPKKTYKIVTRQSPQYLEPADTAKKAQQMLAKGQVQGELRIASPDEFWAPSKYLILVEN